METPYALPDDLFMDLYHSGPVPLYHQVASRIEEAIADGTVPSGTRIDNEVALAERLGMSRPTIRRAIQDLVDKGLLVRRRGIGTQVVQGEFSRHVELTSLFEDLSSADRSPTTQVLVREEIAAAGRSAERLGVPAGSPILHVRRLRLADGVPLALLENYLSEEFLDLSEEQLRDFGLYQLLGARGVDIRVARQRIGARSSTAEESTMFETERHSAVLTMDRVAFDSNGHAVEFGHHSYRPDLYSFEVTLVAK